MYKSIDEYAENKDGINLKKFFPRPLRSILRRCLVPVSIMLACMFLVGLVDNRLPDDIETNTITTFYNNLTFFIQTVSVLGIIIVVAYEVLYFMYYNYTIEQGHLIISTGIFLKRRSAFPFDTINDVYLKRDALDFLFALYEVEISTASPDSADFARIRNLSTPVAAK
ncbi:MAG: PH domain-containing protein, partial [Bdellovibrionales bacterium]|nr:PH domain-containing protein [Bdellovibrionales bacterium]